MTSPSSVGKGTYFVSGLGVGIIIASILQLIFFIALTDETSPETEVVNCEIWDNKDQSFAGLQMELEAERDCYLRQLIKFNYGQN